MATEAATFAELQAALKRENFAKAVDICNKSASVWACDSCRSVCVSYIERFLCVNGSSLQDAGRCGRRAHQVRGAHPPGEV